MKVRELNNRIFYCNKKHLDSYFYKTLQTGDYHEQDAAAGMIHRSVPSDLSRSR